MGTKKTDGLLPPVTEDDTIFLPYIFIILRGECSALVLVAPGRFYFDANRLILFIFLLSDQLSYFISAFFYLRDVSASIVIHS